MKLTSILHPDHLELKAEGRLDASWAEHFLDAARRAVREGHHQLRLDAMGLEYLSSAGIRSLLQTHRELSAVRGSFRIVRASDFVVKTLRMSGFDSLLDLQDGAAVTETPGQPAALTAGHEGIEVHVLGELRPMKLRRLGGWQPWGPVKPTACAETAFGDGQVSLGIGTPGTDADLRTRLGDFVSVGTCTAFLPGDGSEAPDYLVAEGRFVPQLRVADALRAEGAFTHLLRFNPGGGAAASLTLDKLLEASFACTHSPALAAVIIGEVDGLVGLSWARSPGLLTEGCAAGEISAVRDWLSFSGERVHRGDLALAVAFASREPLPGGLLSHRCLPIPGGACMSMLCVPYQPLPQGRLDLSKTVQQLFAGAAPVALLHLVEDDRAVTGLGHSSFLSGACWCAPLHFTPESLT